MPQIFLSKMQQPGEEATGVIDAAEAQCTSLFLGEQLSWMQAIEPGAINGRLRCPGCTAKGLKHVVGNWSWKGTQCSCGRWITPAFQIHQAQVLIFF